MVWGRPQPRLGSWLHLSQLCELGQWCDLSESCMDDRRQSPWAAAGATPPSGKGYYY